MVEGLSHITFVVKDLARMTALMVEVLGGEEIYASGGDGSADGSAPTREKAFMVGGVWIAVMEGVPPERPGLEHVAFKVALEELDRYRGEILRLGFRMREPRAPIEGEARSIYVYDDDNHLFELYTGTLEGQLARLKSG